MSYPRRVRMALGRSDGKTWAVLGPTLAQFVIYLYTTLITRVITPIMAMPTFQSLYVFQASLRGRISSSPPFASLMILVVGVSILHQSTWVSAYLSKPTNLPYRQLHQPHRTIISSSSSSSSSFSVFSSSPETTTTNTSPWLAESIHHYYRYRTSDTESWHYQFAKHKRGGGIKSGNKKKTKEPRTGQQLLVSLPTLPSPTTSTVNDSLGNTTLGGVSCDQWFSSEISKNGTLTSPNYPLPYPASLRCSYHFLGRGKERVQIIFQEFDMYKVEEQHQACEISDSLTAYIVTNGQKEWIDEFCGNELPPRLMSNGHRLTIEFKSLDHHNSPYRTRLGGSARKPPYPPISHEGTKSGGRVGDNSRPRESDEASREDEERQTGRTRAHSTTTTASLERDQEGRPYNRFRAKGFKAIYRFVTNFGVETGRQDSKSVCGFVYNSTTSKNGTFTSPNYPGLYPKDTECHYFFYGKPTERVLIVFTHFDVEGVAPCTQETASDYVEFSNPYSNQRKLFRHCGIIKPNVTESEGDFFRITFKSNGRFDGAGFKATYHFRSTEANQQVKKVRNEVSNSHHSVPMSIAICYSLMTLSSLSMVLLSCK